MRAVELGLGPDDLARLGAEHDRPEWVAAAQVLREYDQVTVVQPARVLRPRVGAHGRRPSCSTTIRAPSTGCTSASRLVVVDEAQELTSAAARLLRVVARRGPRIVLLGDPDVAVQTFRGADPRFLASRLDRPR